MDDSKYAPPQLLYASLTQPTIIDTICSHLPQTNQLSLFQTSKSIFGESRKRKINSFFNLPLAENIKNDHNLIFPLLKHPNFDFSVYSRKKKQIRLYTEFKLPKRTFHSIQLKFTGLQGNRNRLLSKQQLEKDLFESINHVTVLFKLNDTYDNCSVQLDKIALSKMMKVSKKKDVVFLLDFGHTEDDPIVFFQLDSVVDVWVYIFFDCLPIFSDVQLQVKVCKKDQKFFGEKEAKILYLYPISFLDKADGECRCNCCSENPNKKILLEEEHGLCKTYIVSESPSIRFVKSISLLIDLQDVDSIEKIGIFHTRKNLPSDDLFDSLFGESFVNFVFDKENVSYSDDPLTKKVDPGMKYFNKQNWVLSTSRVDLMDKVLLKIEFPELWRFHIYNTSAGHKSPKICFKIVGKKHIDDYDVYFETFNKIQYFGNESGEIMSGFSLINHKGK